MMKQNKQTFTKVLSPSYTIKEEIINSIIHGLAGITAIAGLVLLCLKAAGNFGGYRMTAIGIVSVIIFASTMIGMYLVSTLYHAIQHQGTKNILRKFDHSLIFVFIAGTYTPFCISAIGGGWGWSIFGVQWGLAALGITLNIINLKSLKKFELGTYILMGWIIVVGFVPLVRSVPVESIILLIAGGVCYTLGTIWYRKKDVKLTHAVWHMFVVFGTICHWLAVWYII